MRFQWKILIAGGVIDSPARFLLRTNFHLSGIYPGKMTYPVGDQYRGALTCTNVMGVVSDHEALAT